jgi:general secretion pathway protein M
MNKLLQAWHKRWNSLGRNDRRAALTLLGLALLAGLWWGLVRPFLALWPSYPVLALEQQGKLQTMQQHVQALASLRNTPTAQTQQSKTWLESQSTKWLGETVKVQIQADTAIVQIKGSTPEQIAQWLLAARLEAHALPRKVQWRQMQTEGQLLWQGSVVLQLPGAQP